MFSQGRQMTLSQVLPYAKALPPSDKIRLIQDLAADIAQEEALQHLRDASAIPLWSPHDSVDAAATLQRLLEEEKVAP
jgi:hypothetical protein